MSRRIRKNWKLPRPVNMSFHQAWRSALLTRRALENNALLVESNSQEIGNGIETHRGSEAFVTEEMRTKATSSSSLQKRKTHRMTEDASDRVPSPSESPSTKLNSTSIQPPSTRARKIDSISLNESVTRKRTAKKISRKFDDDSPDGNDEANVDRIGILTTAEVLKSLPETGPQTIVRFEYLGKDEPIMIYWIDSEGGRHHGYKHNGTSWTHQELTNAGHAFAVYRNQDNDLIASYRVAAALAEGQAHVVSLPKLSARIENVIVEARVIAELPYPAELPSNKEWTVSYSFSVPPLPIPNKPDFFETNTIYVWGDLSFDEFPFYETEEDWRGAQRIHNYKMNQIVPQVMCGECLCRSDPNTFIPSWKTFKTWVAQAQHYYQTEEGEDTGSRAVCGRYFEVSPGERMRTTIRFDGQLMHIRIASESRPSEYSEIVSQTPFPNDPAMFPGGWADFFQAKERLSSKTFKAFPCFNIEYKAQSADLRILESLCPLKIHDLQLPGLTITNPNDLSKILNVRGMNFEPKTKPMVEFC